LNLRYLVSFTGTPSEQWFYMVSTAIEAKGGALITSMLRCIQAVNSRDDTTAEECVSAVAAGIRDVANMLRRMHEHCDPQVLYHLIRPFCAGTKDMTAAGLPRGVFYDEGDGAGQWRQYSGGSNGQSSLIQLFDIFLSVEHREPGKRESPPPPPSPSTTTTASKDKSKGYLHDMRAYMPRPHRAFLSEFETISNLRSCISRPEASPALLAAYNDAVAALAGLRDTHIQIVARYIVNPARSPPAPYIVARKGRNLATACSDSKREVMSGGERGERGPDASTARQLHGTGGTSVMPFLKRTRDETRSAAVSTSLSPGS
jgi:indoleamine 2,3-dioxygenase